MDQIWALTATRRPYLTAWKRCAAFREDVQRFVKAAPPSTAAKSAGREASAFGMPVVTLNSARRGNQKLTRYFAVLWWMCVRPSLRSERKSTRFACVWQASTADLKIQLSTRNAQHDFGRRLLCQPHAASSKCALCAQQFSCTSSRPGGHRAQPSSKGTSAPTPAQLFSLGLHWTSVCNHWSLVPHAAPIYSGSAVAKQGINEHQVRQ